ncbi:hypothetical protein [Halovenus halobia]|uniref:hypothetical protein n=1 Tax=Halovenus halobia TaxID=3396622 RepID=UPI003F54776B
MSSEQTGDSNGRRSGSSAEPSYQLRCATARLEAALQSLDLKSETERAKEIITALRATDRASRLETDRDD